MAYLKILYEDQYVIAVDKPAGLIVNPADTHTDITLVQLVSEQFHIPLERAGIIHRLDKDTSGVILIAKEQDSLDKMQALFKERLVKKRYIALVHGHFIEKEGLIDAPIGRNEFNREKFAIHPDGRESQTQFKVMQSYSVTLEKILTLVDSAKKKEKEYFQREASKYTMIELFPKTGRTHQIRVHMHYIHHPIVSDETYTGKKLCRLDLRWCPRHFLHASQITFMHPYTGDQIDIHAELAADLSQSLSFILPEKTEL